jgi:hypothetical protein
VIESDPDGSGFVVETASAMFDRACVAREQVAFSGTRLVERRFRLQDEWQRETIRERITTSGDGRFLIEPLEVLEPSLEHDPAQLALLYQAGRQGLTFRYRDFQFRDRARFLKNYRVRDLGLVQTPVGRTCAHWQIQPRAAAFPLQRVLLDLETGWVLGHERQDEHGQVLEAMRYEQVDFAPDSSLVSFHEPVVEELPLVDLAQAEQVLGFASSVPRVLPDGYALAELASILDPTSSRVWLKSTYDDGLEVLLLLHGDPARPAPPAASAGLGGAPLEADRCTVFESGAWTMIEAQLRKGDFIALSRCSEAQLIGMFNSL